MHAAGTGHRTASLAAMVSVAAALVALLAVTVLLDRAYRAARLSRAQGRYQEGLKLAAQRRDAEAAEDFRAALIYAHDDPKYKFALAQSLVALKRYGEAENYLLELRAADPTNGPVNLMLARIAGAAGRYEEATDDYHRAIFGYWPEQAGLNRTTARLELIGLYDREHQPKQALAELLQLAADLPDSDVLSRLRVSDMLLARGAPEHAEDLYRAILASHPHDKAAWQGLGEVQFAAGDFTAARHSFDAAVRYGSITPALAERIAFVNSILDLDPTLLRLTARQRFERARELLGRTLAAAGRCAGIPPDLDTQAQTLLAEAERRLRNGETAEMLTLAQSLWKARMAACPRQPETDRPLAVLMRRMVNQ